MMASHNAGSDFVWKLVNHCQPTSTVNGDLVKWLPNSKLKPIHESLEIIYPSQIDISSFVLFYYKQNFKFCLFHPTFDSVDRPQNQNNAIAMTPLFKRELLMMGQLFKQGI